ncbi:FmdB family zinc ribbon protein [Caldithrix abyssi]|uniref:Regulatory protein, FmdB family n=1 Tax=Caldithrix abyssi DSM 13497 TaxID=880073 RepID=H1XV56_CALAY|nr:FmdB family zinc ribbon protein [Caldithrix abyssi]APF16772.1 putative regulatory protein, FmdB family [Caldithrix abyssi DSM 13497]EHO40562.1 regulatory protein, FmdB family [Caldithrix abyssi DSM 13497]
MPTYEYICTKCGYEFEEFQSISAEPISICPKCNGRVERKISAGAGLVFKGSGFYITDYKNKENKSGSKKPSNKKSDS